MKPAVYSVALVFAVLSRPMCVAGFVLALLRVFDLVAVPWALSLPLLFAPVIAVLIYAAIGRIDAPRIGPNVGEE